ncbi:hypothetical protein [Luteimonas sp. e5]
MNPHSETPDSAQRARRNRHALLLIALMVFGSFVVAGLLRYSGWQPDGQRNHGDLLQPPGDLRTLRPQLVDGGEYQWNPAERHWRIFAVAPPACGEACDALARELDTIRVLAGRNADRVEIFWLGDMPAVARQGESPQRALHDSAELRAALPGLASDGPTTYIVDPNGFAVLRYAPGHEPEHLRSDLSKLLRLR